MTDSVHRGETGGAAAAAGDLARRYSPGEDVRPLIGALVGGSLGALLALAADWSVPSLADQAMVWPSLLVEVARTGPGSTLAGSAVVMVAGVLAALVFTYGQVRRFLPAPPLAAGLAWGALLWLLAGAALLPRIGPWLLAGAAQDPVPTAALLASSTLLLVETLAGCLLYGACVGVLNPPRDSEHAAKEALVGSASDATVASLTE